MMQMSDMSDTAIDKILKALLQHHRSTEELSKDLDLPMGTVRSTLSTLKRMGFVEPVPEEKRGVPFKLTKAGQEKVTKRADD